MTNTTPPQENRTISSYSSADGIHMAFSTKVFDHYYLAETNMSRSAPGFQQAHPYRRPPSLHPSREKGQKSSYQRLTSIWPEMRKNKSRTSLGSTASYSEGDDSSRESFNSSEGGKAINISNHAAMLKNFSIAFPADENFATKINKYPPSERKKSVSFMIGDADLEEDEIAEDAFQHDYTITPQDKSTDAEDAYNYDSEESIQSDRVLGDHLEHQISNLFKLEFNEESSIWGLRSTLNEVIPKLLRLSEDEPYGVKGAKIIFKFAKIEETHNNNSKEKPSKFSKLRRGSSTLSSSSVGSDPDTLTGFEAAETFGIFEMCSDTVSTFELVLSLKEEKRHLGLSIRNWLSHLTGAKPIHVISPEFSLYKRKLYRMST